MAEALQPDPYAYRTFNEFFTRALKPGVRPVEMDRHCVVSLVDGMISQCGELEDTMILQAKGHRYSLHELLAGDQEAVAAYRHGSFACIYLAPYNYHRIHMPYAGTVRGNLYVPGELFSVNAATARAVPRVFARNERLICDFDTPLGRMAMILVGALHVGSIPDAGASARTPHDRCAFLSFLGHLAVSIARDCGGHSMPGPSRSRISAANSTSTGSAPASIEPATRPASSSD